MHCLYDKVAKSFNRDRGGKLQLSAERDMWRKPSLMSFHGKTNQWVFIHLHLEFDVCRHMTIQNPDRNRSASLNACALWQTPPSRGCQATTMPWSANYNGWTKTWFQNLRQIAPAQIPSRKIEHKWFKASTTKIHWVFGAKTIDFLYAVQLLDKTFHVLNRLVSTWTPHVRPWEKTRLGSDSACFVLQFEIAVKEPALLADGFWQMPSRVYNLARGGVPMPFPARQTLAEIWTSISLRLAVVGMHYQYSWNGHRKLALSTKQVALCLPQTLAAFEQLHKNAQNTRATCRRERYALLFWHGKKTRSEFAKEKETLPGAAEEVRMQESGIQALPTVVVAICCFQRRWAACLPRQLLQVATGMQEVLAKARCGSWHAQERQFHSHRHIRPG